ncbi:mdm2-binding protein-like [Saccostrea echinata]|uniref:mdm2-binding protein-like n=1 Tax=Saccostrea echinata TaxID=191078 RepID=UPI002A821A2A|nr:mdm2-binding protein-like [Saccostrea echinata]
MTRKNEIIFVFSEVMLLKNQIRNVLEEKGDIHRGPSVNTLIFPVIVSEDKIGCKARDSWLEIGDDLMSDLKRIQDLSSEENVSIADKLHEAVDLLPFTGNIIDVYIESSILDSLRSEHSYQLFGALRRLKDWHNAVITFVRSESSVCSEEVEIIQRLLTTSGVEKEDFQSGETTDVIWRGKMSVIDKTINRGFILPGFSITRNNTTSSQAFTNGEDQVLGRMLEMLDEVYVPSIPLFYFTGEEMQLNMVDPHPQSRAMMEVVSNMDPQCGYLCRLACYSDESDVPSTAEKYLSTSSWKESIINDITFVQEPEEELLPPFKFLFFLLTKNTDKSSAGKFRLHVMKSASQISGVLSKQLLMRTILKSKQNSTELTDDPLKGLPVLSSEVISTIKEILHNEQKSLHGENPSLPKDVESAQIAGLQERIIEKIKNSLPSYEGVSDQDLATQLEMMCVYPAELQMDPSEWPEKKYLQYQESQRKSISRLRSTDSLVLSSPIQSSQEDTPSTMGIKNCLKLFQSDGTAICQDLSPIRKKNSSRSQGKLSKRVTSSVTGLQWPDCLDQRAPDIYYNKDKKTEKVEEQCNRIRDRYVTTDTYSSCSSPLFIVNKKPKELGKYVEDMLPKTLRRSPRKAVQESTKGRQSIGVRSSPRKLQKKGIEGQKETQISPTKKINKQFIRVLAGESQRRQSLSSVEIKKVQQIDNTRRKSLTAVQAPDTTGRRESRSERHKRKLEEIVTDVVQQHGVHTGDSIYKACVQKLYRVTKLFVMDLPNSQNLRSEMRNIAEGQVKQVVDLEKRKQRK